jgi:enamine deaminase RidA (YjgF/YER057c/UK114 family)
MEAGAGLLPMPPPATTLVYVKALAAPPMRVEIEAIAVK